MRLFLKTQKTTMMEIPIRQSAITHDQPLVPNQPNCTFIPKKLAMRVGGMRSNDTRVNTFMILF